MKAIRTRFLGQTNTKPHRIVADDGDGNCVVLELGFSATREEAHAKAAQALCDKMGWKGRRVVGWHRNCAYHVFTE